MTDRRRALECGDDAEGSEGCSCRDDGSCDDGLSCLAEVFFGANSCRGKLIGASGGDGSTGVASAPNGGAAGISFGGSGGSDPVGSGNTLTPNAEGWIAGSTNSVGVQGARR